MYVIRERSEGDVERFESALWKAKKGIKEACEIFEDMKDEFGERGSYGERYSSRGYDQRGGGYRSRGYSERDDWEMEERRSRDSMGRYR